ncbi:hypothetical protein B0T17DRAFT_82507 [Bombardia bombarda]|uniref:Uncharacterized protein n=1 Tax=Bombardia bombarda TaxID=252184 RepID=A0AA40CFD0_9PEZI|nr:hypothetical protein B0T17DRAFT_82507 [Bombardia bombarda]
MPVPSWLHAPWSWPWASSLCLHGTAREGSLWNVGSWKLPCRLDHWRARRRIDTTGNYGLDIRTIAEQTWRAGVFAFNYLDILSNPAPIEQRVPVWDGGVHTISGFMDILDLALGTNPKPSNPIFTAFGRNAFAPLKIFRRDGCLPSQL